MPEWLSQSFAQGPAISADELLFRLLIAAFYGVCVALVYRLSHGRLKADGMTLITTLALLSILIAMVSLVIGESIARAFSLVGALSIVRFRTVVEDTRDTAFVIFAVIVGMAAGAGHLVLPLIGIPVVGVAAVALSRFGSSPAPAESPESTLAIRLGLGRDPELVLDPILAKQLESFRLVAAETARQGAALDLKYAVRLKAEARMAALVTELNQVEGVQGVDLRR